MTEAAEALKPCPFDGSDDVEVLYYEALACFAVLCNKCECDGPIGDDKAEAIAAWNCRASAVPAEEVERVAKELETRAATLLESINQYIEVDSALRRRDRAQQMLDDARLVRSLLPPGAK